jgi:hypothetical protein
VAGGGRGGGPGGSLGKEGTMAQESSGVLAAAAK